jgi:hypothetical protein
LNLIFPIVSNKYLLILISPHFLKRGKGNWKRNKEMHLFVPSLLHFNFFGGSFCTLISQEYPTSISLLVLFLSLGVSYKHLLVLGFLFSSLFPSLFPSLLPSFLPSFLPFLLAFVLDSLFSPPNSLPHSLLYSFPY